APGLGGRADVRAADESGTAHPRVLDAARDVFGFDSREAVVQHPSRILAHAGELGTEHPAANLSDEAHVLRPGVPLRAEPSAESQDAAGLENPGAACDKGGLIGEVFAALDHPDGIKRFLREGKRTGVYDLKTCA